MRAFTTLSLSYTHNVSSSHTASFSTFVNKFHFPNASQVVSISLTNYIIHQIEELSKLSNHFRVLALSATPGSDARKIQTVS